ncbi:hypothetical protein GEMRC1_013356 [Eukaryota sp. GEM-RC1]
MNCFICSESFDLSERIPLLVCSAEHTCCSTCSTSLQQCPICHLECVKEMKVNLSLQDLIKASRDGEICSQIVAKDKIAEEEFQTVSGVDGYQHQSKSSNSGPPALKPDSKSERNSFTPMFFSPRHKHSDIIISNSGKRISYRGSRGSRSILGDEPLVKGGVYRWKVRYQSRNFSVFIGMVPLKNFDSSLPPWKMTSSKFMSCNNKGNLTSSFSCFRVSDVLELTADMVNNTFSIKEITSGCVHLNTHCDAVDDVYYPVFGLYHSSQIVEIVD